MWTAISRPSRSSSTPSPEGRSAAAAWGTAHRPLLGIATLVGALAILPGMDAIAKHLSGHLPVLEIAWARFLIYALFMLPLALRRHGRRLLRPARPVLQLLRGGLMAFSALMFFSAVAHMPLADCMAVFFVYPLVVLVASALVLGERIGTLRWAMVVLGFIGTALVIRPSAGVISAGVPFALASGLAYAGSLMLTRQLAGHDPALVTSAISAVLGAIAYSVLTPYVWVMPAAADWPLMALMGAIAALGHFLIVRAHRWATAAELAPFGYAEIVAAILFGFAVFGDVPAPLVWLGIAVIIASGIVATWSNGKLEGEGQ